MSEPIDFELLANLEHARADERHEYLLEQAALNQELWILTDGEGSVLLNSGGEDCVPVWPHEVSAAHWANKEWADCTPKAISVKDWLSRWSAGLEEDELSIASFPNRFQDAWVGSASEFDDDLRVELNLS